MTSYLLKATLIWGLFLALYELLYKKSCNFSFNRLYLLLALAAGLLLPFLPWPFPGAAITGQDFGRLGNAWQYTGRSEAGEPSLPVARNAGPGISAILLWLYLTGVLAFLALSLREIVLILRTAVYGHYTTIGSYKIFSSNRQHAPFSFMGWVFLSDPSLYDNKGLQFIFRHEDAHNRRWHWLDTILMQLLFIVFWFHPLIWRYRYLMKLNHEYEADRMAATDDAYSYGHFLLQQTLLKGTPAIAHSFHFSPIKNRITMLTQTGKMSGWKYALTIPMLLGCAVLFAKSGTHDERVKTGNTARYKGHEFKWSKGKLDSMWIQNPESGEADLVTVVRGGHVSSMDGDSLYANEHERITQAQFRHNNADFRGYLIPILKKDGHIPDSFRSISLSNMVIDESGKLCYYDIDCLTTTTFYSLSDPASPLHQYGRYIDKIIEESPAWLPALANGKKIKVLIRGQYTIYHNFPEVVD